MNEHITPGAALTEVKRVGDLSLSERRAIVYHTAPNVIQQTSFGMETGLLINRAKRSENPALLPALIRVKEISNPADVNTQKWVFNNKPALPDTDPEKLDDGPITEELRQSTLASYLDTLTSFVKLKQQYPQLDLDRVWDYFYKLIHVVPMLADFLKGTDPDQTVTITDVYDETEAFQEKRPVLQEAMQYKDSRAPAGFIEQAQEYLINANKQGSPEGR